MSLAVVDRELGQKRCNKTLQDMFCRNRHVLLTGAAVEELQVTHGALTGKA